MAYFEVNKKPRLTFPTLTGSIVTFNSQYAGLPLKSHKIALTATQSGSGTPSPTNPRPITGYSAINISHSDADTSNPTVYTIQIGSTVYGGEYDARTGVLTVTHGYYDLGQLAWTRQSSVNMFTTNISDMKMKGNLLCSIYSQTNVVRVELMSEYTMWNEGWAFTPRNLVIKDTRYTDSTAFKTAMNGIICVFELATPTTIQLPPCPIDTLEGVNNIWADTGDTTLQYPKFG